MLRVTLLAALLGAATTLPVLADQPMIKDIDVETTLTDLQNPQAAARWKTLDSDLENAIASQLVGRLGDEGMEIRIDMNEVEMANFFQSQLGTADTRLSGTVNVIDLDDNSNFKTFDLTVRVDQVMPEQPEGADADVTIAPPSDEEIYAALVAAFASGVVARIDS